MKKFFKHIPHDGAHFWEVSSTRSDPKPFPGPYPTRWKIVCAPAGVKKIVKPSYECFNYIRKLAKKHRQVLFITEFDKGGAIRSVSARRRKISPALLHFYYPWHYYMGSFFDAWKQPVYSKLLKLGKRRAFVYSPLEKMLKEGDSIEVGYLREHKKWLRNGLWK